LYEIFVDASNIIYISNYKEKSVRVFDQGSSTPTKTISNVEYPGSIFVTMDRDIFVSNRNKNQVDKWTSKGTNRTTVLHINGSCFGIFVDINNTLYCSIKSFHQVVAKLLNSNENSLKTVAGNGGLGSQSNMLSGPHGIFVDIKFRLYVADCGNDRVQRFDFGHQNGTTLTKNITLRCPTGVLLDGDGYLFIVDSGNHRIVGLGSNGFRCIVGCSREIWSWAFKLDYPSTISFDSNGNIFVVDANNEKIEKFYLEENICGKYHFAQFCHIHRQVSE
jgi:DNA-binding beta-propeller fold protein YncE